MTTYMDDSFAEELAGHLQEMLLDTYALAANVHYSDSGYQLAMGGGIQRVETFEEAMVLSGNKGLVVTFNNGSQAQVTIVAATPGRR